MASAVSAETAQATERVEIVMPLTPAQIEGLNMDLERLAELLDLPSWASNTELILEAVHRQAHPG